MKKILFNIPNTDSSGIPIIWLIKIKKYQQSNFETYLSGDKFLIKIPPIKDVYKFNRLHFRFLKKNQIVYSKYYYIYFALKNVISQVGLLKKTDKEGVDLIYSPSSVLDFIILPYLSKITNPKTKWVTVFDNTVPLQLVGNYFVRFLAWFFFQLSVFLLRKADHIYVITPILKEYLTKRGLMTTKITVTGCGVESDLIAKAKYKREYVYDGLYIGRLHDSKGIFDLLKVLAIIVQKNKKISLAIMGNGDKQTEKRFMGAIKDLCLQKNVFLLGYVSGTTKYSYLRSCRSFWYLSYDDSFGVALLEAVSMGKKCFVYDLKPFRYLYQNNEVVFHKMGAYESVAKNITSFLKERQIENSKGGGFRVKWSWGTIVEKEIKMINLTILNKK